MRLKTFREVSFCRSAGIQSLSSRETLGSACYRLFTLGLILIYCAGLSDRLLVGAERPLAAQDKLGFWSLKTVQRPPIPQFPSNDIRWGSTPIDAFVLAKLREKGLTPSPEAHRQTLIRRLHFDLTGLPPLPEAVEQFVNDSSPFAYERLVDRLLASTEYGERWARHWLDVVHYGDTHGYDKDQPRPNAWPYRDYVIRSLNEDKPYREFVLEQIAGDVLFPGSVEALVATGFIAAGPWDLIGHMEVPEEKIDGQIARHLDRDDMVSNTMNTFVSMTVQCARCHNHKFDPVTQEDYYSLQAVFAALDRADKIFDADPVVGKKRATLERAQAKWTAERETIEARIAKAGGDELAAFDKKVAELKKMKANSDAFGYHSQIMADQNSVKWVQVDLGKAVAIERLVYVGCHDDFNGIGAGFGFPVRFKVEISDDPTFNERVKIVADHTQADVVNPGVEPQTIILHGKPARFIRMTATKLAPRQNDYIFALAELSVFDSSGENVARAASVTALDSIEAPARWQMKNLVDGHYYGAKENPAVAADIAKLEQQRKELLDRVVTAALKQQREEIEQGLKSVNAEIAKLPKPMKAYVGTVHTGKGAFAGTGHRGGKPRSIQILARGDVQSPIREVGPGTVPIILGAEARFNLGANHAEGERRVALAKWIVDSNNPLSWRSIVNRVWQYHFGRGLVDSPNDFGRMGQLPTHPELLDWLATEFRDGGQSLKQLHRMIVNSSTYRQSSAANELSARVDASNQFLWRMNRRRLEAEAIRDSVLFVSGKLNKAMYGPGFQDFVVEKPEHSPHYGYHLHDPTDPRAHRRSIYRFIVRSQPQPFMQTLDCADPSLMVDKRNETQTALQALALLNNPFMTAMSKQMAARVETMASSSKDRVNVAFRLALARDPNADEIGGLTSYAEQHGLANACRLILNLNEFVFVD